MEMRTYLKIRLYSFLKFRYQKNIFFCILKLQINVTCEVIISSITTLPCEQGWWACVCVFTCVFGWLFVCVFPSVFACVRWPGVTCCLTAGREDCDDRLLFGCDMLKERKIKIKLLLVHHCPSRSAPRRHWCHWCHRDIIKQ